MRQNSAGGRGFKTIKAFVCAIIIFAVFIVITGLLIRFTPLPERWASFYVLAGLCLSCLFLGIYSGNMMKRRGIIFGALFSVIFILLISILGVLITGTFSEAGIFQLRYLICIIVGGIGGMIGVNV